MVDFKSFSNKSEYKAFISEWKKEYAELTAQQQQAKTDLKQDNRTFSHSNGASSIIYSKAYMQLRTSACAVLRNKVRANKLLDELEHAKCRAQQQYEVSKSQAEN